MSEEIGEACSPSALDAPVAVTSGSPVLWGFSNRYREHCASCGSFVNTSRPGTAWAAVGEFGEDTEYICHRCTAKPGFRLVAGNGSADPKWCGYVKAGSSEAQTGANGEAAASLSRSLPLNPHGEKK